MAFNSEFVETVRAAGDIARVVGDYVPLKQAGTRLKGLCPFHQEKTPSFSVDPEQQLFYCFGCQTGGDLFKFVMLYEKVGFPEAVETLAQRFGVPLPDQRRTPQDDRRDRALEINDNAWKFFRKVLAGEAGQACRDYLDRRGLDENTVERLGMGFAPPEWEALRGHLVARRFRVPELLEAGVLLERKSGRGEYDRFRNRLMFPIRDINGRVIAFGGRVLPSETPSDREEPKYINSPETPTYTKGNHLYGLDAAREAIRREGSAIVVEGYMDLAAVAQAGFDNVVATLGTAFTAQQARLLSRYATRVVFSYDGDGAGAAATVRSLDLLIDGGFDVRVVELPGGCDPDDFIRRDGRDAYAAAVRQAPAYLDFLVRREMRSRDLSRIDEKVAAVNAVLPHLCKLTNTIERAAWASRLADALQIDDELVLQELRTALAAARTTMRQRPRGSSSSVPEAEVRLVSLLMRSPEHRAELRRCIDEMGGMEETNLVGTAVAGIVTTIERLSGEIEREEPGLATHDGAARAIDAQVVLNELNEDADRDLFTRIVFRDEPEDGPSVEDCLWAFRRTRLQRRERQMVRELGEIAAKDDGGDDLDQRLLQIQELARQRDTLQ